MKVAITKLQIVLPKAPIEWLREAVEQAPEWGIDSDNEMASFLAQLAHESCEFTKLQEDLSYSAPRLMAIWPRRFPTLELAQQYERNPQRLANFVYANRLGNGDEASMDGWNYRGRGPIQLTGKDNYITCEKDIKSDIVNNPDLLCLPKVGIKSACWFWKTKGLDLLDDDADVAPETKRINGGTAGLQLRQYYFDSILRTLGD